MANHDSVTELRTGALSHKGPPPRAAETIAKARALRAEHAQAAAYQAHRAEQARAAANTKTRLAGRMAIDAPWLDAACSAK